jgi:hypothetical protein
MRFIYDSLQVPFVKRSTEFNFIAHSAGLEINKNFFNACLESQAAAATTTI